MLRHVSRTEAVARLRDSQRGVQVKPTLRERGGYGEGGGGGERPQMVDEGGEAVGICVGGEVDGGGAGEVEGAEAEGEDGGGQEGGGEGVLQVRADVDAG